MMWPIAECYTEKNGTYEKVKGIFADEGITGNTFSHKGVFVLHGISEYLPADVSVVDGQAEFDGDISGGSMQGRELRKATAQDARGVHSPSAV